MKNNKNNSNLAIAIVLASVIIAGSLFFFRSRGQTTIPAGNSAETNIDDAIAKGIEGYIKKQQEEARKAQQAQQQQKKAAWNNLVKPNAKDHLRGNKDAEITIIEYSDYECPFCKRFHPTMKQVLDEYKGKVNWVYRNYPLPFHAPIADKEAEATECVAELGGNDKYWEFSDLIFATTRSNKGLDVEKLPEMAESIGINRQEFETCLNKGRYSAKIEQEIREGSNAGVSGTPGSFILNNKTGKIDFINGAQPFSNVKSMIDAMLQ